MERISAELLVQRADPGGESSSVGGQGCDDREERRALGVEYKGLTPGAKLREIYERNRRKYGDELGPTIDWLRDAGKSWDDIIDSASRSGGSDLK